LLYLFGTFGITLNLVCKVRVGGFHGTEISLYVGGISLICSKNHIGIDHGALFRSKIGYPTNDDAEENAAYDALQRGHNPSGMG
jgi:hypothetical protein